MCLGRGSSESPLSSESFIHSTSFLSVNISCSVSSRRRPNARTWCIFNTVYPTIWFWLLVQLLSRVLLFATLWTAAHRASLSFTISQSLLKLMSIESVMLPNYLIFCEPLLLLPSIFPSIRVFSSELAFPIRWPKYWSFSNNPSNQYSGLISFTIDWFDLLSYSQDSSPAPQFESIS